MPAKTARRRAAARRPEPEVAPDGPLARAVDHAFENPAMSGGLAVMAITAMAIMSNAMFLQHGQHPEPLFATRPAATAPQRPAPIRPAVPSPRRVEAPAVVTPPPMPRVQPMPTPAPDAATSTQALVTAIQRELARLGLYTDAIDGLAGSRTRAAISTWQNAAGMKVTGEPTTDLLAALQKPTASLKPAAPAPVVAVPDDQVVAAIRRAAELEHEQAAARNGDRLRRVQVVLSDIGYGQLVADGQLTSETADALRRFQLDQGLPVTGELDDGVIKRLIVIGAMKAD